MFNHHYRLSEDPRFTVGVIEAGGLVLNHPSVDIPGETNLCSTTRPIIN